MSNTNTFNSLTAKAYGILPQLPALVEYLVKNRNVIISGPILNNIWSTKSLTRTPISDLFDLIRVSPFKDDIVLINIPPKSPVPEILQYRHVVFDMLQLKQVTKGLYDVIDKLPEFANKIVINVTEIYSTRNGTISDSAKFRAAVVKGLLSRLYYLYGDTAMPWVPPQVTIYASAVFGSMFSTLISDNKNLDVREQSVVNTILSYYYFGLNSSDVKAITIQLQNRHDLGDSLFIKRVVDMIIDRYGKEPITFEQMCDMLKNCGIPRLETVIDQRYMYTQVSRLYSDQLVASTAIDYPPFWLFLILESLSTMKTGMAFMMKNRSKSLLRAQTDFIKGISAINVDKACVASHPQGE